MRMPEYVGPCSFGIKMGMILPGSDLENLVLERIKDVAEDGLLEDNDVICVTESVVARSQNNYITTDDIAEEIREKLFLSPNQKIGVLFPLASRNRFSLILEGIVKAVPEGEVIIQFSYPNDEVGNQIIPEEVAEELEERKGKVFTPEDLDSDYTHPLTGVNYVKLYEDIIEEIGPKPTILFSNDPNQILSYSPDGVIIANIHARNKTKGKISNKVKCCTMEELFAEPGKGKAWSEMGLLGSNMSSNNKLKLAPYKADKFAIDLQSRIRKELGKSVEIIISGDGAYKDPSSGIYELADPYPVFGATPGVRGVLREGVKTKYLIDEYYDQGKSEEEIKKLIEEEVEQLREIDSIKSEGTTPRRVEDILASLADLISGSADAGTPLILIKGIYDN